MSKLLRQDFFRLKKSFVFYLTILFMVGFALIRVFTSYEMMVKEGYDIDIGQMLFSATLFIGLVGSVFSGLFFGTEYSDGTMRNKLIVGHSRVSIYLSNFITLSCALLMMFLSYSLVVLVLGLILFGFTDVPLAALLLNFGSVILLCISYAGLLTVLSMLIQNKALGAVIAIVVALALLATATAVKAKLEVPEYQDSFEYTDNSGTFNPIRYKDPNYLEGQKREAYQFALDINPAGQGFELMDFSAAHPFRLPLYSLALALILVFAGIMLFRRSDIK